MKDPINYEDDHDFVRHMFSTEQGKRLLAILERKYYHPVVANPGQPAERAFYNEGRRSVVKFLQNCLQKVVDKGDK